MVRHSEEVGSFPVRMCVRACVKHAAITLCYQEPGVQALLTKALQYWLQENKRQSCPFEKLNQFWKKDWSD